MSLGIILGILSALALTIANIADKFVMTKKVENIPAYFVVVGWVYFLFAFILTSIFGFHTEKAIYPLIAGTIVGIFIFFFYKLVKEQDVSSMISLYFIYPIPVAIISWFLFGDSIGMLGYLGILICSIGAILMGSRLSRIHFNKTLGMIGILLIIAILLNILNEYVTLYMTPWEGFAIECWATGLVMQTALFSKKTRQSLKTEAQNFKYAIFIIFITGTGVLLVLGSFALLTATIATAITVVRPLFVWILELLSDKKLQITQDKNFLAKLIPISMITVGILLLYLGA